MQKERLFGCRYGYFSEDGREYIITRPDTPKPWVNVISNGDYGLIASQTGSGFSWLTNSNLNRITRYSQDLVKDEMGKFIFIRDRESHEYWSAGWKPVCTAPDSYECRHGIGYSRITSENHGIQSELTIFVSPDEPVEIWILKAKNNSKTERSLGVYSYLEWNLGVYNVENREFQKIFIDTIYDETLSSFFATKRLWEVTNSRKENMNANWDYIAFHSASELPASFDGDRESFIGLYGAIGSPRAMKVEQLERHTGKWVDGIASLQLDVNLKPDEEKTLVFVLGVTKEKQEAAELIRKYKDVREAWHALDKVAELWEPHLQGSTIETPDQAMNFFTNTWLKYQTISCRLWSRTAFYQSGGAFGFRDQLQDSQMFLTYQPELTMKQILLHARHQYTDGTVKHWWQPMTEEGPDSHFSDDLLWLTFVVSNYLLETGDFSLLDMREPYLDGGEGTIYEHCKKSLDRAFRRFSPRGIPLIGEADWNDGLSACGTDWIGESFWVGEFLYDIIHRFEPAMIFMEDSEFKERCGMIADLLKENLNKYGWDGEWYLQCTTDGGKELGSKNCQEVRIFLNPQVWAILSGIVPEERLETVVRAVQEHLVKEYGSLLLYPAYTAVDEDIGYLTRYAPGLRENGGVYSHAATWAIQAFCKLKMPEAAYDIYKKICAINRSFDIECYKAEPYVMPGNTDGPDSPNYGRGGWTWYTGSAAWLFRVTHEHILGLRPAGNGLKVDPCIPSEWKGYQVKRIFRNAVFEISFENPEHVSFGVKAIYLNGRFIEGNTIPVCEAGSKNQIRVILGKDI